MLGAHQGHISISSLSLLDVRASVWTFVAFELWYSLQLLQEKSANEAIREMASHRIRLIGSPVGDRHHVDHRLEAVSRPQGTRAHGPLFRAYAETNRARPIYRNGLERLHLLS